MFRRIWACLVLTIILTACTVEFMIVKNGREEKLQISGKTVSEFPELSCILNKTGNYSLAYIYAHGRRLAAVDNSGAKYFYLYDAKGGPLAIMNGTGSIIWEAGSYP